MSADDSLVLQFDDGRSLELQGPLRAERRGERARFVGGGRRVYVRLSEVDSVEVESFALGHTLIWIAAGLGVAASAVVIAMVAAADAMDLRYEGGW